MKNAKTLKTGTDKTDKTPAAVDGDREVSGSKLRENHQHQPGEPIGQSSILDYGQLERVLAAIASGGGSVPDSFYPRKGSNQLDPWQAVNQIRDDLIYEISWAYTMRDIVPDIASPARAKSRATALTRVRKLSKSLRELIEDNDMPLGWMMVRYLPAKQGCGAVIQTLREIEAASFTALKDLKATGMEATAPLQNFSETPGNAFMAAMAKTYEAYFGQIAFKADAERQPMSPFINFVQRVAEEMGELVPSNHAVRMAAFRAGVGADNKKSRNS